MFGGFLYLQSHKAHPFPVVIFKGIPTSTKRLQWEMKTLFHVKKSVFHAENGFLYRVYNRVIAWDITLSEQK